MKRDAKQVLTELLVLKAQGGDERAFSDLYELWAPDVLRLARFSLKESASAKEVSQDAWIAIAKGISRLDDPARFPAWAFRILNRRIVDWVRRCQRERMRRDAIEAEEEIVVGNQSFQNERAASLAEAIERLDTDSRKLIHLFYETGLPVLEIAVVLDIPEGTVKSRLYKTREKLKQYIERK